MKYCLFSLFISIIIFSQEQSSYRMDRFSGINGALIEPTHTLVNQNSWDINLLNVDVFHQENYAYISKENLIGLQNATLQIVNESKNIYGYNTKDVLDFNTHKKYFASNQIDILGPSFNYRKRIGERDFSFGVFTRAKSLVSGFNVDENYNFYNFLKPNYFKDFNIGKIKMVGANWAELGLNLATRINRNPNNQVLIGTNLKYLKGFDAFFINQKSNATISFSDKYINIKDYNLEAAYSSAYNFDTNKYEVKPKGNGFSGDFGITYVENKYERHVETEYEYNYKISLSILDVGYLKYEGEKHQFIGSSVGNVIDFSNFESANNPSEFLQTLSKTIYGDPVASKVDHHFLIGMPTSIFLSYDKNLRNNKNLSFAIQQRIPIFENSLKKNNLLLVNYSTQKNYLGYGITGSLVEYKIPQFGGYFRIGPLFLGSDNLLPIFINQRKLDSFDFYFGIKLFPFWDTVEKKRNRQKCNCTY